MSVPTYRPQVRLRGEKQQNKQVNTSADAFGAAVGRGMQDLANGLMDAGKAFEYRAQLKREADARYALDAYTDKAREIMYDPETGYMNASGGNAIGEARDKAMEALAAARSEIARGLDPGSARIFDQQAMAFDNQQQDRAITHESSELRSYTLGAFKATARTSLEEAIRNADNDEMFLANLERARSEVANAAALEGKSGAELEDQLAAVDSSAYAGRTLSFARSNPVEAFAYLQAHRGEIDVDTYNTIYDALEPAYYAEQARNWVAEKNVTAGGTSSDLGYGGFPAFIVGPESGGNAAAVNSASGAGGIVQFMPGTWMGLINQIKPAWAEGMSKQEILDQRFDPKTVLPIYNVFRAQNAKTLQSAGFEVNPRNEYIAHHFGAGGAVALLRAAAEGDGSAALTTALNARGINTASWVEQNPWMEGKTVNGALAWFARKTSSASDGTINPALSMEDALNIEDPKLRAAVMTELTTRQRVAENARGERDRLNSEAAWGIIDQGGSPDDIPMELRAEVGAATMNTIFDTYERNQQGVDFTKEERYLELFDMAVSTDKATKDAFLDLDLNEDRPNLSQGDLRTLKVMQADMRDAMAGSGPPELTAYTDADFRGAMNDVEAQYMGAMGYTGTKDMNAEDARRMRDLQMQVRQMMQTFAASEGRAMSYTERAEAVDKLLSPVIIEGVDRKTGWGPGDTRLFEVRSLARDGQNVELQLERADVPFEVEQQIVEQLSQAYGRAPTADEIVEQYENELMLELGLNPAFEYRDIPKDAMRVLREQYPDASPDEIVLMYKRVTLEAANRLLVE